MPRSVNRELLARVELYLEKKYIKTSHKETAHRKPTEFEFISPIAGIIGIPNIRQVHTLNMPLKKIEDYMKTLEEPFNLYLLRLIDEKGKTDAEVYKNAQISRQTFAKIRKGEGYLPSKRTVLALAIGLELTLDETEELLAQAGYAFSHNQKLDVIVEFFIINKTYKIAAIDEVLLHYDQPLLGDGVK